MPKLVVEEGDQKGAVYNFRARNAIVVGRGEDVDFVTRDSRASRRHFTIEKRKDAFYIRDLGSTNGTFLNDTPVKSERLKSGGKICVGQTIFVFLDEDEEDPLLGQSVGGYLIHARVGKGGMGTVYMASQLSMDRVVALKILSERLVKRKDFVSRFISEARSAGRLNHPNIVQVHDVGKADKIYYYSMEFMRGGSIQDLLLRVKKIPFAEAIPMIIDAARGLEFAESRRMVHRDIKPDNLMLADDKTVKICDLGLAEILTKDERNAKREIVGSPHYMSPEQASRKSLDHRSDIYSLGATFYRVLAGRTPFSGKTSKQIIQKHITGEPEPLKEFGVPRAVVRIAEKMMDKDPDKRYSSATEVISDLEKLRSMPQSMVISRERVAKRRFRPTHRRKEVPFVVGAIALAFLALLICLLLYLFVFHPKPAVTVGDAGDGVAVTPRRPPPQLSEKVDLAAEALVALSWAEAYRRSHPGEWDKIIAEYRRVASKFSGTEEASLAEKMIKKVEKEREKEKKRDNYLSAAEKEFLDAEKQSSELVSLHRYSDAIKKFSAVAEKYPDTRWGRDAKAQMDRLPSNAKKAYRDVIQKAEPCIKDGRHDEAKDLYRTVISNYGIPAIVKDAQDRMAKISELLVDDRSKKAEDALRRASGLLKARAFGEALTELRNVSLEDLSEDLSSRVRREKKEAGRLNTLKQKLIAVVNGQVMAVQGVTIEEGLRGKLVRADEAAITIELPRGETIKSWEELSTALICNIATRSDLESEEHLALGILCLKEDQPRLALVHLQKAAESDALETECRPYILEAERGAHKEAAREAAMEYGKILETYRAGEFNDVEKQIKSFIAKYPDFSPKEGPTTKDLLEECEGKKREALAVREAADRMSKFHKITKTKIYAKSDKSTKNARRYHWQKDLEEARVVARFQNFTKSASMLQKIVMKEKRRRPDLACDAACELAKVLVKLRKDASVWIKRAEALEQKIAKPVGIVSRTKTLVENYPSVRESLMKTLDEQKESPLAPDVQWKVVGAYNNAGLHLDCLAAVIRMEKDFAEDSHVKSGDAVWLRAQLYRQLWLLDETLEALNELVESHPKHSSVTRVDTKFMMADIYWYKNRRLEAAEIYRVILARHPELPIWQMRVAQRRIAQVLGRR